MRKKFTMLFAALSFMAAASAQVLTVSNAPVDGKWDESTTWYIIQNKKGGYVSSTEGYVNSDGFLLLNNITKPAGDAALWCVVGNETDGYKFYNKSAGTNKILSGTGVLNSSSKAIIMTETSAIADTAVVTFDIAASQKAGYLVVKDHGSDNNYWNYRDGNLAYWNSGAARNDDGSSFVFATEAELASALVTLNNSLATANEMLTASGLQYAANPIALQTETAEGAGYISCSNLDPTEGNNMKFLIDNDNNTYIHTNWHNLAASKDYFDVYLGEGNGISLMQFSEVTRGGGAQSDFPASIEIWGSTDGKEYTTITTVSGLPTRAGASYTSPSIECNPAYIYLRFIVTGSNYAANRPYWHMAEFDLYSLELSINEEYKAAKDAYIALSEGIDAIQAVAGNANSNVLQLNAANETLQGYFTAIDEAFNPEKYALMNRIEELSAYLTCGGTTVGYLPEAKIATLSAAIETAQAVLDNPESVAANYTTALENLNNTFTELDLFNSVIMPEDGAYYALKNNYTSHYMNVNATAGLYATTGGIGIGEVFQFVNDNGNVYLKNVERGTYISTANAHSKGQNYAATTVISEAKPVEIKYLGKANQVSITPVGGATLHHDTNDHTIVAWNAGVDSKSSWSIEAIEITALSHVVSISDVKWSTLVLGYDAIIPEGVTAYAVTEAGNNVATLTEITGTIPAYEAVLLNADEAGSYRFKYAESAEAVEGNLLEGSTINKNVEGLGYVLAAKNDVGLYKATLNKNENGAEGTTHFNNNAFKAYLPVTAEQGAPAMFAFTRGDDEGTTGIEGVEANEELVIFDLAGRRVQKMEKGIYIVNGKKVVIK